MAWFSPDPRGVLFFDKLHVSQSFKKFLKKNNYQVFFNRGFKEIITHCAFVKRKDQGGTWITSQIIESYTKLYESKKAYCVGIFCEENLVGGLYGVCLGNYFSGESMFSLESNASKLALYSLIVKLRENDVHFLDTQMITSLVEQFGGEYIPREHFINLLSQTHWELDPWKFF